MKNTLIYFGDLGVKLRHDYSELLNQSDEAMKIGDNEFLIMDVMTMDEFVHADDIRLKVDNLTKAFSEKGEEALANEIKRDIERNGKSKNLIELYEAQRYALFNAYEELTL